MADWIVLELVIGDQMQIHRDPRSLLLAPEVSYEMNQVNYGLIWLNVKLVNR